MAEIDDISNIIQEISPFYNKKKEPSHEHKLVYDSSSETLEPVYFWILDKMGDFFKKDIEKLVDNFTSSPGSGHFSELMGKATRMQEEAMKIMQTTGVLIKSIINLVYDLKEFEILIGQYNAANSENKEEKEAGLLALKQRWMDNVDVKRGRGSINMMAQDLQFVTLRDAFMMTDSVESVDDLDLNDRVKRILKPRMQEFLLWKELSEKELKKRYSIEKTYLKNQLNSLKLYTGWAKPYLKASTQLEQKDSSNPALVTAFNTIILELALLGKSEMKFEDAIYDKKLPEAFLKTKLKRKYHSCVLIDFVFRGIPQKAGQHYVFGGRAEVTFKAYALNDEEIELLKKKRESSNLNETLALVSGMTDESLKALQEDLDYFLKEGKDREKDEEAKEKEQDSNPFSALFSFFKSKEGKKEDEEKKEKEKKIKTLEEKGIKPDSYIESMARAIAEQTAKSTCFVIFDVYKKAHGMASHPGIDFEPDMPGKSAFQKLAGI